MQAARLPESLAGHRIERIVSSPLARCVESVLPLARILELDVESRTELEPEVPKRRLLRLLGELPPSALVCTHRETFETLFEGTIKCEKGGAWLVERRGGRWKPIAYLPPPEERPRTRVRRAAVASG
ncbi:MAG: histidine phosphatase family protein [Actinobacteria bacterium]|nr:histidine phosphatase family protein [Actinomycetota bacterium]